MSSQVSDDLDGASIHSEESEDFPLADFTATNYQTSSRELPAEVPDSQPDPHARREDGDSDDVPDLVPDTGSNETAGSESPHTSEHQEYENQAVNQGVTDYRYDVHDPQLTHNGHFPDQAPGYEPEPDMDQATQQATQPYDNPRLQGAPLTDLELQDEADVLCLLHAATPSAWDAVELILRSTPQHTLTNHHIEGVSESAYDAGANNGQDKSDSNDSFPGHAATYRTDIALRMSSVVRDPRLGFVFGRNSQMCDILLAKYTKLISSAHFRIYVNEFGVLMLEDMSTNGTIVDNTRLKSSKPGEPGHGLPSTRMITHGDMIHLPVGPDKDDKKSQWIRFMVRFPDRNDGRAAYDSNLAKYIQWTKQAERRGRIAGALGNVAPQPMPFAPLQNNLPDYDPVRASRIASATSKPNQGMMWNGDGVYNVVSHIGKGAFALVFKLSTVREGVVYACKQIEKRRFFKNGQPGIKMRDEIEIMSRISHPNIVKYVDRHETNDFMFIIMEFVPLGDLTAYTAADTAMHEGMGQAVASQICEALKYLHSQKITHRDVKPDNILVACHIPYIFKLSDFGLSKVMKNEESQMRTFCGTILYCAPEIYPGFQRAQQGLPIGRAGRHWQHPPEQTRPYEYSVDTWGIAAVLFHLLCGHPPWTGTQEDNGATMLNNIMKNPINWERLTLAGVSDVGIDFLRRMLVIDPALRATEDEVLAHPWITELESQAGARALDGSAENAAEEDIPDASQLRIQDNTRPYGLDGVWDEEIEDPAGSQDSDEGSTGLLAEGTSGLKQYSMQDPRHPAVRTVALERIHARHAQRQANKLLFGEVPGSALASSGLLGQNAHAALGLEPDGNEDLEMVGSHGGLTNISSIDTNYPGPNHTSAQLGSNIEQTSHITNGEPQHSNLHHLHPLTAPSLHGAEADTDQLNMGSPESGGSGLSAHRMSGRSQTPTSRDLSPSRPGSKRASQHLQPSDSVPTSKRARTGGPVSSSSHSLHGDDEMQPKHSRTGLNVKGKANDSGTSMPASKTKSRAPSASKPLVPKAGDLNKLQPTRASAKLKGKDKAIVTNDEPLSPPSVLSHLKTGTQQIPYKILTDPDDPQRKHLAQEAEKTEKSLITPEEQQAATAARDLPSAKDPSLQPNTNTVAYKYGNVNPFIKAPIVFGVLIPTEDSIETVDAITINNRATTFGRDTGCTFVHPAEQEGTINGRVPRSAINLTMWYPGLDEQIDTHSLPDDWYKNPEIECIISTQTTPPGCIWVNNVPLEKSSSAAAYGRLRTGDVVTVVQPDEKRIDDPDFMKAHLRFVCNFYHGASKKRRSFDDQFVAEYEHEKYAQVKRQKKLSYRLDLMQESRANGTNSMPLGGKKNMTPEEWEAMEAKYENISARKYAELDARKAARESAKQEVNPTATALSKDHAVPAGKLPHDTRATAEEGIPPIRKDFAHRVPKPAPVLRNYAEADKYYAKLAAEMSAATKIPEAAGPFVPPADFSHPELKRYVPKDYLEADKIYAEKLAAIEKRSAEVERAEQLAPEKHASDKHAAAKQDKEMDDL